MPASVGRVTQGTRKTHGRTKDGGGTEDILERNFRPFRAILVMQEGEVDQLKSLRDDLDQLDDGVGLAWGTVDSWKHAVKSYSMLSS